jgi:hypothetical protein
MLIDMDTLCHGNPIYEFASIFNAYVGFENVGINTTKEFFGVPYEQCKELFDKIMHKYFSDKNDEETYKMNNKTAMSPKLTGTVPVSTLSGKNFEIRKNVTKFAA